jgi:hypothetical protein
MNSTPDLVTNSTSSVQRSTATRVRALLVRLLVIAFAPVLLGAAAPSAEAASRSVVVNVGSSVADLWAPTCSNYGYGTLAGGGACGYGHADVYTGAGAGVYVYKDVKVWEDGVSIQNDRFVTQCIPGQYLCGTDKRMTVWMWPGVVGGLAPDAWSVTIRNGKGYCFQTTVWFYEGGRWLSYTLTSHAVGTSTGVTVW